MVARIVVVACVCCAAAAQPAAFTAGGTSGSGSTLVLGQPFAATSASASVGLLPAFGGTELCPADLAPPSGVLDLGDIDTFIGGFLGGDPIADLAPPAGILDLDDIDAFIASFLGGCP